MKRNSVYKLLLYIIILTTSVCYGQTGIINTIYSLGNFPGYMVFDHSGNLYVSDWQNHVVRKISTTGSISVIAGNGISGSTGDGGPANAAELMAPYGLAIDPSGNLYIADHTGQKIRKVSTSGIITTFAGTGINGFSGDGGAATSAQVSALWSITTDASGNVYIADYGNGRIRKVDLSGIITTVAGNGSIYNTGDNGPATAAGIHNPIAIALDRSGNFYMTTEQPSHIRKVNTSGIITTLAGTDSMYAAGDGGPADSAALGYAFDIAVDASGNIYVSDFQDLLVRKINTSGIITTLTGTTQGYSGDGGPANLAQLNGPWGITLDPMNNVYLADYANFCIRKITYLPTITSSNFSVYINKTCAGPDLLVHTNSYTSSLSIKAYYGDGSSNTTPVLSGYGAGYADVTHAYSCPGIYTIKLLLLSGASTIDSISYTYRQLFCQNIAVKFYYDTHGNCVYDSTTDPFINLPITTEVDSNGLPVDTISATSGFYYTAYGSPGDIYTFRVINAPYGLQLTCPAGSLISDTLSEIVDNSTTKHLGFSCNASVNFDLAGDLSLIAGRHLATASIIVDNNFCNPENAVVTMNISPKYVYQSAYPAPSSVIGNTITWDMSNVSAIMPLPQFIHLTVSVPYPLETSSWLTPGDTVDNMITVSPFIGDTNASNNVVIRTDTIKSSYDPNEMGVDPIGYIGDDTVLQYTINFENTGNDTAHNIYIMDTLSDNVSINSLKVIAASSTMNNAILKIGAYRIAKFEFPNINLLDSSHHDQCNGMLRFAINLKSGLANGTTIFNHAGIFFDDNPVVMTDTVEDITGVPPSTNTAIIQKASNVFVFPNPATDQLSIIMAPNAYNSLTVCNNVGQEIMQQSLSGTQTKINIAALPAGIYYVTFRGENGILVKKFVKM